MTKFTLHYFNGAGRAEAIRWVLAHAKVDFEDHRIADWPAPKANFPLGQLPVLEWKNGEDKVMICQSAAILRFVGNQVGLAGRSPLESVRADEAFEALREFQEALFRAMFESDEAKKAEGMAKVATETAPKILDFLEKRAAENGGKNLAGGESFTYADLFMGAFFEMIQSRNALDLSSYPSLLAVAKATTESEGVKAYLENRPKGNF